MTENKYNRVTLYPQNENEQELFFKFRTQDIAFMLRYAAIFISCLVVFNTIQLFTSEEKVRYGVFALYLTFALLRWLVIAMGSRFKDAMIALTVGLFVIEQVCITVTIEMLSPMTST